VRKEFVVNEISSKISTPKCFHFALSIVSYDHNLRFSKSRFRWKSNQNSEFVKIKILLRTILELSAFTIII
jgi:hypothetical protein